MGFCIWAKIVLEFNTKIVFNSDFVNVIEII